MLERPEAIVGRILGLTGYVAYACGFEDSTARLTIRVRQDRRNRYYECSGCGISVSETVDVKERSVRDLPWSAWQVYLIVEIHRVRCRRVRSRLPLFHRVCFSANRPHSADLSASSSASTSAASL